MGHTCGEPNEIELTIRVLTDYSPPLSRPISRKTFEAALAELKANGLVDPSTGLGGLGDLGGPGGLGLGAIPREIHRADVRLIEDAVLGQGNFGKKRWRLKRGHGYTFYLIS